MNITNARVIVCCPGRNFVTLKIETDEGLTGIGDATLNGRELAVAAYLTEHVIPCLIDPDIHLLHDVTTASRRSRPGGSARRWNLAPAASRTRWSTASCRARRTPTANASLHGLACATPGRWSASPFSTGSSKTASRTAGPIGRPVARLVTHAEPFEKLKLCIVNGSHSALAYLGAVAGWPTVDRAIAEPAMHHYLDTLMRDEIAPTLPALPGLDLNEYRARLLQRFANPELQHQTQQITMDNSQKLPRRLPGTVRDRLAAHIPIERLALAMATWLHDLRGINLAGVTYVIHDPLGADLAARLAYARAAGSVHDGVAHFVAFAPVFGDLGASPRFIADVARHALSLQQRGVAGTLGGQP